MRKAIGHLLGFQFPKTSFPPVFLAGAWIGLFLEAKLPFLAGWGFLPLFYQAPNPPKNRQETSYLFIKAKGIIPLISPSKPSFTPFNFILPRRGGV